MLIQRAVIESSPPPEWWPLEWKTEFATSCSIRGGISLDGKKVSACTVFFTLKPTNEVFPAKITKGVYSMMYNRMPVSVYEMELRSEDGPEPQICKWEGILELDQGLLGITLPFQSRKRLRLDRFDQ